MNTERTVLSLRAGSASLKPKAISVAGRKDRPFPMEDKGTRD